MVRLNSSNFIFPVGRVNLLRPEGHSGQRKLQAVVGSIEIETGIAVNTVFFTLVDIKNDSFTSSRFQSLYKLMVCRYLEMAESKNLNFSKGNSY